MIVYLKLPLDLEKGLQLSSFAHHTPSLFDDLMFRRPCDMGRETDGTYPENNKGKSIGYWH